MKRNSTPEAIVFGLFETGLGVARSLGQKGIHVTGIDFKKDIAWYSRYVKPRICPHPLKEKQALLVWVKQNFSTKARLPVFLVGFDWKKNRLYKMSSTDVAGHFRWQPCGPGRSQVKLIWIDDHSREYKNVVKAQKQPE